MFGAVQTLASFSGRVSQQWISQTPGNEHYIKSTDKTNYMFPIEPIHSKTNQFLVSNSKVKASLAI